MSLESDRHPGWREIISFAVRSRLLKALRAARNLTGGPRRLPQAKLKSHAFIWGESITSLHLNDDPRERVLTRGKIENLRRACRRINGTVLAPGEVFSFWKQVGPPWAVRGFVTGREVREGCVLPTVGGGLCQLSGSLFEAANRAGLRILESHRHTVHLKDAAPSRDATVFWNYVDLRFSAPEPMVIEARMTPDELIIRLRAQVARPISEPDRKTESENLRAEDLGAQSCLSCGKIECVQHQQAQKLTQITDTHVKTAAILDAFVPEFDSYLSGELIDIYYVPMRLGWLRPKAKWYIPTTAKTRTAILTALARSFYSRWSSRKGRVAAETRMKTTEWLARAFARKMPHDVEHLIISQDFLPFLWNLGVLQGRSFDVLLTRPALSVLHKRLDLAGELLPASRELGEFRAAQELVEAEGEALVYAERVITPHEDYARYFPNLRKLEWQKPEVVPPADVRRPQYLLFPSSLTAREGAHAALAVSEELSLPLLVIGRDLEGLAAESDLVSYLTPDEIPWSEVAAVVHPTLIESWPRLHLQALALEIPVIVTDSCGLEEGDGVTIVPFHDPEALLKAVERVVARQTEPAYDGRSESGFELRSSPRRLLDGDENRPMT